MGNLRKMPVQDTAKCPFFMKKGAGTLVCEGIAPGSVSRMTFSTTTQCGEYYRRECCELPRRNSCGLCRALLLRYAREEQEQ